MAFDWKRWFEGYANDWTTGEISAVAARYAPTFLVSKPGKSAVYSNDDRFVDWLEQVRGAHLDWGLERVEVVTLREDRLGDHHELVTVTWAVRFQRTAALRIQFEISYLVVRGKEPQILTIVSHEDQRAAMSRYGLL